MKKKLLLGTLIVALLVVGAAIVIDRAVDAASFRKVVEARAEKALGRPVSIGDLRFAILPVLGLRADHVAVAARPGTSTANVLTLKSLRIGARLLPLLRGRLEVTKVVLVEPSVDLARDRNGNWNFELPSAAGTGGSTGGPAVAIDELRVVDGRVHVRDASRSPAAPLELTLDRLDLEARGLGGDEARVSLSGGHLAINDPALGARPLAMDIADARLTIRGGGKRVEMTSLQLAAGHTTIALSGDLEEQPQGRRIDLELKPTRIAAADLGALAARLTDDPTLSLSGSPVSLEGEVHGLLAPGHMPEVQARLVVDGVTFRSSALTRPISDVHATATFDGTRLEVQQLTATAGASDLGGDLTLELSDPPVLHFDLQSRHADLGELAGLSATGGGQAPAGPGGLETRVVADGTLKATEGSLADLHFQDLAARLHMKNGVATLEPVTAKLYAGSFEGRLATDLGRSPQAFEFAGTVNGVDVGPLMADAAGLRGALAGRASGRISGSGAGTDPKAVVASLKAEGTADIVDGELGRLDILGQVGKVAGVLGQQTLARVAGGAAQNATRFSRLATSFTIAGGTLRLDRVALLSPTFDLTGSGNLDLADALLDGHFQISFSPEVSGWMKKEGSRAADLFWDQGTGRVTLPVQLKGPLDHPGATVDWGGTIRDLARGRVESELGGILGNLLGKSSGSATAPGQRPALSSPSASKPPTSEVSPPPSRSSSARAQSASGKLALDVEKTEWAGSFLAQDYKIRLRVRGATAERIVMKAVDATGRQVQERTVDLAGRMAGGETSLELRVDGKRLLLAAQPVIVTITAEGGGESATVTVEVPSSGR